MQTRMVKSCDWFDLTKAQWQIQIWICRFLYYGI